jgi:Outer membrane protein beta-barrel domain
MWTAIWPLTMNTAKRILRVDAITASLNLGLVRASFIAFVRYGFHRWMIASLLILATCFTATAQSDYTRVEFGGEFSTIRQNDAQTGSGKNFPGFGGRFDWNFNRRLAFETEVDFFPEQSEVVSFRRGGQTLQAVFGLRAKVLQTRRLSVFGLVRPGLFHFTDVLSYSPGAGQPTQKLGATYFEVNLGGGIEYYLSPRWVLRADIAGNPYRVSQQTRNVAGVTISYPGSVEDTTRLSFGVAYRPGTLRENEDETKVPGNCEFGPLFSTLIAAPAGANSSVATLSGLGGYASYRFWRVLYFDSDVLYFPQDTHGPTNLYGGPVLQGLFGLKGGIRRNDFGFFGKVRPGFQSYAQALDAIASQSSGTVNYTYGRSTNLALDLGGIVEFYPTGRGTLRIEAGDSHTFFSPHTVNFNGKPLRYDLGMHHTIQLVFGYGWRF